MQTIDRLLVELKSLEQQAAKLNELKESVRKEIFGIVENEGLTDGYKNEVATVSYVERKTVKVKDEEKLLADLAAKKIVRYFHEVPAHLELTPEFTKEVKAGKFKHPDVEVEVSTNLAVKFVQEELKGKETNE